MATRISIADLISQGVLFVGDGYRTKLEELSTVGLPFARAGNIDGGFRFEDADRFPEENLHRVGNKVSRPGDVVFTSKGTVGRFAIVSEATPRFVYSPQLCFWRVLKPNSLDPRFLFCWMSSREFHSQFTGVAGQTDMAEYVSLGDQRRMHITLPDFDDQRAIANVLGALDRKVELNRRMNATLESIALAIFKSWFVDTVTPNESSLDEIADFLNGLALQKFPPTGEDDLPVIKIAELRRGDTKGSDLAGSSVPPEYIVNNGDVLFSWSGSLEVVIWCGGKGALNQHLFKVTSRNYPKWFYFFWIKQHLNNFRAIASGKATTMGHIQRHHLTEALVGVPGDNLLRAGDALIAPMLNRMICNNLESRTLTCLREALLPKLISGEIRIKQAEKIVEAHA